ncbi:MAG: reverse transcriptase/maturase family protein [Patescibacteria group bacterium]
MKKNNINLYEKICSFENLHLAYVKARKGKRYKNDILQFGAKPERNLLQLREELLRQSYQHGGYREFVVHDSKKRNIKAAPFRDRVVHHALCNVIEPIFDKGFIYDSYACRRKKGTQGAVLRMRKFLRGACVNNSENTEVLYVLKCDIAKYFDNVNHEILLCLIGKKINDEKVMWLVRMIVESTNKNIGKGIPIGNLTSQLFANVYLNELDQFVKHTLRKKRYIRYMDDFVVLGGDKRELARTKSLIGDFLQKELNLSLHPKKSLVQQTNNGIDFLGYVLFELFTLLRKSTVMRFVKRTKIYQNKLRHGLISQEELDAATVSWVAYAKHARSWMLRKSIGERFGDASLREAVALSPVPSSNQLIRVSDINVIT